MNRHVQSVRVPRVCVSVEYTLHMCTIIMDLSMSITDDDHELDRILESTNLDEYEIIDLPMEQQDDSSH